MNIKQFIDEWFPKTKEWDNVAKFILESGIQITEDKNPKWLTGYTNIGRSSKPHHKDEYIRYMEENMFMLHDIIHQIFTLDTECSEEEYIQRQIYGELFTFYLTEYVIPGTWRNYSYRGERGCYDLVWVINEYKGSENIIDYMWKVFLNYLPFDLDLELCTMGIKDKYLKYRKMFQEDLENSRKNYKFVPKVKSFCMVGDTSQNHIDFFEAVKKGAVKNIRRDFNLKLPDEWI